MGGVRMMDSDQDFMDRTAQETEEEIAAQKEAEQNNYDVWLDERMES
jgi:hypothetical protein